MKSVIKGASYTLSHVPDMVLLNGTTQTTERIVNPDFPKVLMENAACNYCCSHQYELARYWYAPAIGVFADGFARRAETGDRSALGPFPALGVYRDEVFMKRPLGEMRPTSPRTQARFAKTLVALADAAERVVGIP